MLNNNADCSRISTPPAWLASASVAAVVIGFAVVIGLEFVGGWIVPSGIARSFGWGIPALLIVGGVVGLELAGIVMRSSFALLLGAASYALYLFHPLAMQATVKVMHVAPLGGMAGAMIATGAALTAAIVTSITVHLLIEKRVGAFSRVVVRRLERALPSRSVRRSAHPEPVQDLT